MRRVSGLPLALLFLASVYPSNAQSGAGAAAAAVAAREMRVPSGAPLLLECELGVAQRLRWRLDGGELPGDMSPAGEAARGAGAVWARLTAAAAQPHHAGLYTCSDDAPRRAALRVSVLPPGEGALETAAAPPAGAGEGEGGDGDVMEVVYEVRGNLSLDCSALAPGSARAAGAASAQAAAPVWRVNGTELDELPAALRKRYKLAAEGGAMLFVDGRSAEDDFGNYSCAVGGKQLAWSVRARTLAKLPANSNVVEGQKLKLTCKLVGKPYPAVEWLYSNVSEALNDSVPVAAAFGSRVSERASEQGVAGAELVLEGARRADAGWLTCRPQAPDALPAVTRLRVKDMYAALWPFLGICAEVFVLCAIILVYEKRRTKPELDDSDTDNHDQTRTEPALRPDEPVTVYIPLRPHPEPAPYQSVPPPIQPAPATIQSAPATIQSAPAPIQSGPAPIQTYTIRWDAVIQSTPAPIQTAPAPIQPAPPTIKAAPETIQSAPATIQSAPAPIQAARTPIQTGSAPIQSAPATIKAAPEPIQSAPATIQSALAPIQAARTPIQTAPAPIQSAPAPMQSGPDPIHSVPAPIKSAAASALYHSPPTPVQSAPVTAPRHATNTSAQAPDHRAPAADQSTPARYSAPTTPDHPAPAPDHTAPSMLLHSIPPVAPPDYLSPPDTPPPPQPPLRCLPL